MARTDLSMLRDLMRVKQKLTSNQATVFRRMLEDLEGGMQVSLSKKQRMWVEQVYLDLDLDKEENKPKPPPVRTPVTKQAAPPTVFPWETNKPLKPPGRK